MHIHRQATMFSWQHWRQCSMLAATTMLIFSWMAGIVCGQVPGDRVNPVPDASRAIVQLFGWRWTDVAQECEWLRSNGFGAVQISPAQESVTGRESGSFSDPWWQMYQPVSYRLNSRFGTEQQFKDMVTHCAKFDIAIYADAVLNHMAAGDGIGDNGTQFTNRNFPGTYSPWDFHHCNVDHSCSRAVGSNCGIGDCQPDPYKNDGWVVQNCDLVGLPDLQQDSPYVRQTMLDYINKLASFGVKGIRIDAAKHINHETVRAIVEQADPSLFVYSEVIDYDMAESIQPQPYTQFGSVLEFRYAADMYHNFMSDGKVEYFESLGQGWGYAPQNKSVVLVANHDTLRDGKPDLLKYNGRSLNDATHYKLATQFMMAHHYGYPKVFSGYYWNDKDEGLPLEAVHKSDGSLNCFWEKPWICEHRWTEIAGMAKWRASIPMTAAPEKWQNFMSGNVIAFSRAGQGLFVLNNGGDGFEGTVETTLPTGTYSNLLRSDGMPLVRVNPDGTAQISVEPKSAVAVAAQPDGAVFSLLNSS